MTNMRYRIKFKSESSRLDCLYRLHCCKTSKISTDISHDAAQGTNLQMFLLTSFLGIQNPVPHLDISHNWGYQLAPFSSALVNYGALAVGRSKLAREHQLSRS